MAVEMTEEKLIGDGVMLIDTTWTITVTRDTFMTIVRKRADGTFLVNHDEDPKLTIRRPSITEFAYRSKDDPAPVIEAIVKALNLRGGKA